MRIVHYHFKTIGSTNTWAKEHAHQFDPQVLTLVTADHQTAGRGRFKRRWESPDSGNIYATYCFFVEETRGDIGHIPQLLALTAAQVLEKLGFNPSLKWPNDILLSGKKLSGILCETVMQGTHRVVICGIGLNVNMSLETLQTIDRPATSLKVETGSEYSVDEILKALTQQFVLHLEIFLKQGFDSFFPGFKERSALKTGQLVKFHDNQHLIQGIFEKLNPDGSVTLQLPNGSHQVFYAGEFVQDY